MSHPIAVGDTLTEAFQFGLKRWGSVLRFCWLPGLLSVVIFAVVLAIIVDVEYLWTVREAGAEEESGEFFRTSAPIAFLLILLAIPAVTFLYSGAATSIFRLVSLGEERPGIFQLRTDATTVRTFWAFIILNLINFGIFLCVFFIVLMMIGVNVGSVFETLFALFNVASENANGDALSDPFFTASSIEILTALLSTLIISLLLIVYPNVRLAPFVAGSAVESRVLLVGALSLTRSRFWSIFSVMLIMVVALMLMSTIVELASGIIEMIAMSLQNFGGAIGIFGGLLLVGLGVVGIIVQTFYLGVQLGLQGIIYRRLKTGA